MVKHNNTLAKAGNFRKNWQVRIRFMQETDGMESELVCEECKETVLGR
jgi:hypothetical protein